MPLPSVLLHDHLDGGLRPASILELSEEVGIEDLPADNEAALSAWFDQSQAGSLEAYLSSFEYTLAVLQEESALERVAYEAVIDLADDGVVYAEIRFCPALHTARGLSPGRVVEAVASGMRMGELKTGMRWGLIVDTLRQFDWGTRMARVAAQQRSQGVVGFDIAGPEAGHPPDAQLDACRYARQSGLRLTIHAGEAAGDKGVAYMASAMDVCGAERLGHGLQLVDDCVIEDGEVVAIGSVARRILDRQIPLEMCPASNLATNGLTPSQHPIGALYRAGFNVTLSTDNRLMSNTSMSSEFEFVTTHHGFEIDDLARTTRRSLAAAFCTHETKAMLWEDVIAPAYTEAGADVDSLWR